MAKKALEGTPSWMPIEGESSSAYAAFLVYKDLGIGRKVTHVERALEGLPGGGPTYLTLIEWKDKYKWEERVLSYDSEMAMQASRLERDAQRKSIAFIQKEKVDRIKVSLALVDEVRHRALQMLSCPMHEMVEESRPELQPDGKTLIIRKVYMPAKWMASDIPKYLDAAMRLEKMVLFEDASISVDATPENEQIAQTDLDKWRRKQIEAITTIPEMPINTQGSLGNPIDVGGDDGSPDE